MRGVHVLVVLGAEWIDPPLVSDFVAISKRYIYDGLDPTCITSFDLRDCLNASPRQVLYFGRDDIPSRPREDITSHITGPRFYTIHHDLKEAIRRWITHMKTVLEDGDKIIISMSSHGIIKGDGIGNVVLAGRPKQYLSRIELAEWLGDLAGKKCRILLTVGHCCSGGFTSIAKDPKLPRDVEMLVQASSPPDQPAKNFRSSSGNHRCGVFYSAVIEQMVVEPAGMVSSYVDTVRRECVTVDPNFQDFSIPEAEVSRRFLWSASLSHFKPARFVVESTELADQRRQTTFMDQVRNFWRSRPAPPPIATSQQLLALRQAQAGIEEDENPNLDGFLDLLKSVQTRKAPRHMEPIVINTIKWIVETELKFGDLVSTLTDDGILVSDNYEYEGCDPDKSKFKEAYEKIWNFFGSQSKGFHCMISPPTDDCAPIFLEKWAARFVGIVAYHCLADPTFDTEQFPNILDNFFLPRKSYLRTWRNTVSKYPY